MRSPSARQLKCAQCRICCAKFSPIIFAIAAYLIEGVRFEEKEPTMSNNPRGYIWQRVALSPRFVHRERIEIIQSSRKLPDCDNSWARKAVNRNAAGAEPAL
jgi:hypothetical protein